MGSELSWANTGNLQCCKLFRTALILTNCMRPLLRRACVLCANHFTYSALIRRCWFDNLRECISSSLFGSCWIQDMVIWSYAETKSKWHAVLTWETLSVTFETFCYFLTKDCKNVQLYQRFSRKLIGWFPDTVTTLINPWINMSISVFRANFTSCSVHYVDMFHTRRI